MLTMDQFLEVAEDMGLRVVSWDLGTNSGYRY